MTTAAEIKELRYLAEGDRRRAAAGFIDINPFSTSGARALWHGGFEGVRPALLVDGSTNWRYWERGRQARILCDEANQSITTHTQGRIKVQHPHAGPRGFELADEKTGLQQVCQDATEADARRLAACWNVCDGMDAELLENILMLGDTMATRFQARDRVEQTIIADRLRFMQERDALQVAITSIMEAVGRKQMADFIEKFGAPPPDTTITTNSVCGKPGKTCKWVDTQPFGHKCTTCGDTIPF